MPIHDWTRVDAGIFHHFHHEWISAISSALNGGLLPPDYYALAEQQAAGFGPDVLTLQGVAGDQVECAAARSDKSGGSLLLAPPRVRFSAESSAELQRRKSGTIVVRHTSGDAVIAVVEVISPANKHSQNAFDALVFKATELLHQGIHLLILDVFPPTKRDPQGVHAALWKDLSGDPFTPPADEPLTFAAYDAGDTIKSYVETAAVGSELPTMPLFLEPGAHVLVPLEATYMAAFDTVPLRWRNELKPAPSGI
jgi:hypothetical protein